MYDFVCADCAQDTLNLALVQYQFTQGEHEVKVAPHGNSRSKGGYMRTMPSVMSKLRAASSQMTPKRAIDFSHDQQGGILWGIQCRTSTEVQTTGEGHEEEDTA